MTVMQMGSNIELTGAPVRAALRWTAGPGVPEVDLSALLVGESGQVGGDTDFVFYNQPQHPSGAVQLSGSGQLDVDPARVPASVARVVVAASATGGTFGQVPGFEIVLGDAAGTAIASFPMQASSETAFLCAELYRRGSGWKFRAVGQGYASGLAGIAADFGIQTGEAPSAPAAQPPAPTPTPPAPAAPPTPAAPPAPATAPATRSDGALDLDAPWPTR